MKKAVFLDRDGIINHDTGYIYKVEELQILPGVIEGLVKLQKEFLLFIITNQSGIGRGYYTTEQYKKFQGELEKQLNEGGITITETFFCPHTLEAKCECRKPSPFFLNHAAKKYGIELKNSFMIGDRKSDVQTGHNAGTKAILVKNNHKDPSSWEKEPHFDTVNFKDAIEWILSS